MLRPQRIFQNTHDIVRLRWLSPDNNTLLLKTKLVKLVIIKQKTHSRE